MRSFPASPAASPLRTLAVAAIAAILLVPAAAGAQEDRFPPSTEHVRLGGPRVGLTWLGGAIVDSLRANEVDVGPVITQFGWQWERVFYNPGSGPVVVSEWVLLVGGLEQSTFLPSLSWLMGFRTPGGTEFGVGPNVSVAGFALAVAGGVTTRWGAMNVPVNVAIVPSRVGPRLSILSGISMR